MTDSVAAASTLPASLAARRSFLPLPTVGGIEMDTKFHVSSGKLQIAAVLMLIKACCVWPPNSTWLVCCVTMPDRLEMDGASPVNVKPASATGGPAAGAYETV